MQFNKRQETRNKQNPNLNLKKHCNLLLYGNQIKNVEKVRI